MLLIDIVNNDSIILDDLSGYVRQRKRGKRALNPDKYEITYRKGKIRTYWELGQVGLGITRVLKLRSRHGGCQKEQAAKYSEGILEKCDLISEDMTGWKQRYETEV